MFCCAVGFFSAVHACDPCGCMASNFSIGLMRDYQSNFVRLSYFESRFSSSLEHGHHNFSDIFSQVDLSFRYSFARLPKLRFVGHLPYRRNLRDDNGLKISVDGISDIKFLVNYALLSSATKNKNSLYVEAGGGFSLPTGKYNTELGNSNLSESFNIGNGSLGYIFQLNSVLTLDKYGCLVNNYYQVNNRTKQGYHFGNQFSSQLTVFREFSVGNFDIIPNIGLLYEKISKNEYSNKNSVPETGGKGLFFSSAINLKTANWLTGASYSLPIEQNYSSKIIEAGRKVTIHLSYIF